MSVKDNDEATPEKAPQKKLGGVTGKGFQPGKSGNPYGGPRKPPEFVARCKGMTNDILDRLAAVIKSGEDRDAIPACKIVLAYSYGNPAQPLTGEGGGPIVFAEIDLSKLSDAQLAAIQALRSATKSQGK